MNRKVVSIGIMPQEEIRARVLAIAKGKYKPKPGEPKSTPPHHSSMLIHVTRYNSVQTHVRRQVEEYLSSLRRGIVYGDESRAASPDMGYQVIFNGR